MHQNFGYGVSLETICCPHSIARLWRRKDKITKDSNIHKEMLSGSNQESISHSLNLRYHARKTFWLTNLSLSPTWRISSLDRINWPRKRSTPIKCGSSADATMTTSSKIRIECYRYSRTTGSYEAEPKRDLCACQSCLVSNWLPGKRFHMVIWFLLRALWQ